MAPAGTQGLVRDACAKVNGPRQAEQKIAYTDPVAVASRAVERLIFRACSLTLDLASSMEELALAAVDRWRTKVDMAEAAFVLVGARILE